MVVAKTGPLPLRPPPVPPPGLDLAHAGPVLGTQDAKHLCWLLPANRSLGPLEALTSLTSGPGTLPGGRDTLGYCCVAIPLTQALTFLTLDLNLCIDMHIPTLGPPQALTSLTLDLYCASEERLTARVVAPPNLQHLSVSSDRIRWGTGGGGPWTRKLCVRWAHRDGFRG